MTGRRHRRQGLSRANRAVLRHLDYMVLSVIDDSGAIEMLPAELEAAAGDIVAIRLASDRFPQGERKACLCAHRHSPGFEEVRQLVVFGRVTVRGREARLVPSRALRMTKLRGALGDLDTGLRSTIKGRRELRRIGRQPVSLELLRQGFAERSKERP